MQLLVGDVFLYPIGVAAVGAALAASRRCRLAQRDLLSTQRQLSHQSLHDTLTGLPNRVLVIDRAAQMLARARRNHAPVAALYVDIDGFKDVNDSFGHAAGDELLRVIGARLREVIRESDTVGRLGDDEFVVLLENLTLDAGPELVAERICEVLSQPVSLAQAGGRTHAVTTSVGIALGQEGSADELLRDADFALYEAKGAGKNRWMAFESRMQAAAQDRIGLEMDMKSALDDNQFFLLYQPLFDLRSETITGVEALIRWHHPVRGLLAPSAFVPIAEQSGLIVPIGRWVLHAACTQAASWQQRDRGLGLSINVSGRQLDDERFVADVAKALERSGLDPDLLTLEITETTLMRDAEGAVRRLTELKALGVQIAVDDFGTGYSSLSYLRQFPVDVLKIDRSFVAGVATSAESRALIHTLVALGRSLGLKTLGEGIEERSQLRYLQREHCDFGQGFLFGRPLEPGALEELLELGSPQRLQPAA
jgi:diguanylate cyclase (GGDEF)-like protein